MALPIGHGDVECVEFDAGVVRVVVDDIVAKRAASQRRSLEQFDRLS